MAVLDEVQVVVGDTTTEIEAPPEELPLSQMIAPFVSIMGLVVMMGLFKEAGPGG